MKKKEKTLEQLRDFGEVMAVALLLLSFVQIYRLRSSSLIFLSLAGIFLICAFYFPQALRPVEKAWMKFGEKMGTVTTAIILLLTYFLVIAPLGMAMRIFGKDLLFIRPDPSAATFWIDSDHAGSGSRYFTPY